MELNKAAFANAEWRSGKLFPHWGFGACLRCRVHLWQKFQKMESFFFFFVSLFCQLKSSKVKYYAKWSWPMFSNNNIPLQDVDKRREGPSFTVQTGGSPCQYASSHSWQAKMKLMNKHSAIFCHYHPFLFILPNNKNSFFKQPKFHFVIVFDSAFWPRWVMQSDKLALAIVASSLTQTCRACWVSWPKNWKVFWKNSDTLEVWTWFPCQWEKQKK